VLLAGNDRSSVQAFRIGERVWGTQFHPEGTAAILDDLVRARRDLLVAGAGGGSAGEARYREILRSLSPAPWGRHLLRRFVEQCRRNGRRNAGSR
jgi:GMP synthase-like glutamine amidotransferase